MEIVTVEQQQCKYEQKHIHTHSVDLILIRMSYVTHTPYAVANNKHAKQRSEHYELKKIDCPSILSTLQMQTYCVYVYLFIDT